MLSDRDMHNGPLPYPTRRDMEKGEQEGRKETFPPSVLVTTAVRQLCNTHHGQELRQRRKEGATQREGETANLNGCANMSTRRARSEERQGNRHEGGLGEIITVLGKFHPTDHPRCIVASRLRF